MTNLLPYPTIQNTAGEGPGQPGGAPINGTLGGNPQESQITPNGNYPPGPQNSPSILLATQIANGNVPLHTQPTNVNAGPGNTSLLALMATGQIVRNDSNYGNASFAPVSSPATSAAPPAVPVPTGVASAITLPAPLVYSGN